MPRAFNERERERIRSQLIEKGRELFASYGLRRTNVEDLTGAVGISKGAFYLFFDSKEALFFEIVRQFEGEYRAAVFDDAPEPGVTPRERVRRLLERAFSAWRSSPLFTRFTREDYEHLRRRLPPEALDAGLRDDVAFTSELLARWQAEGMPVESDPALVTGLMRALFYVSLHADDFDPAVYPRLIELLIDLVAGHLVDGVDEVASTGRTGGKTPPTSTLAQPAP